VNSTSATSSGRTNRGPAGSFARDANGESSTSRPGVSEELLQEPVAKSRAHFSDVGQPVKSVVGVVVAEKERADGGGAVPFAGGPPSDDELLRALVLHLEPGGGAFPGQIEAVEPLGDHSLQPLLDGGLEHRLAMPLLVGGSLPVRPIELQIAEQLAALDVGALGRHAAIQVEDVEGEVEDGRVLHAAADVVLPADAHAALEDAEVRPSLLGEGDDLAVQDGLGGAEGLCHRPKLRGLRAEVSRFRLWSRRRPPSRRRWRGCHPLHLMP
jgi:hypothetical protein